MSGTPWSQSAVIMGVNIFLLVFLSCACALSGASVRRTKYSLLGSTINSLGVSKPGLCVTAIGIGFKIIINLIIKIVIFIQSLYFPVQLQQLYLLRLLHDPGAASLLPADLGHRHLCPLRHHGHLQQHRHPGRGHGLQGPQRQLPHTRHQRSANQLAADRGVL